MMTGFQFFQNQIKAIQIVLLTLVAIAVSADALAGRRSVTKSSTDGSIHRSGTITGPGGNTATREVQRNRDSQPRTWNKSETTTGPDGQSTRRSTTATRSEDGYTKSTTVTGPQGNTATREAQGQWDPQTKTWTRSVTVSE